MMEEDATEEPSYKPLGKGKKRASDVNQDGNPAPAPIDSRNFVYLSLLSAGIGFVLPYNSFIVAADYWQERFKGKSVALDMSFLYVITAFLTVLMNNILLTLLPFKVRVRFGYIVSFTTLIFIAVCEVGFHVFSKTTAYSVCLASVCLVAFGCTIQQSSFYGFSSMFPKQYTQAVMAGESVAGLLVSTNRVLTKLLITNERISTVIFFFTSVIYIGFSFILHIISLDSPFVRYYTKTIKKSKIVLVPDEEGTAATTSTNAPMSFSNPVYDFSNAATETAPSQIELPNVAFKVEHEINPSRRRFGNFKYGLSCRWRVARAIYPYMASIALAYCVTLSLYPGIESEIISCNLGSWMPVLLMFTFNAADVLGKVLAAVPYQWTRRQLVLLSTLRVILVPLLVLCIAPRESPIVKGETASFIFTAAFGLTNGLSGSLPMILAPSKVPATLREISGNMMTLSYNIGLVIGSWVSKMFDAILGEPITDITKVCPVFPYAPYVRPTSSSVISTSSALISSAASIIANVTSTTTTTPKPPIELVTMLASKASSTVLSTSTQILYESSTENYTEMTELILLSTTSS